MLGDIDELVEECDAVFFHGVATSDESFRMPAQALHEFTQRLIFHLGSRDPEVLDRISAIFGVTASAHEHEGGLGGVEFLGYVASVFTQIHRELESRLEERPAELVEPVQSCGDKSPEWRAQVRRAKSTLLGKLDAIADSIDILLVVPEKDACDASVDPSVNPIDSQTLLPFLQSPRRTVEASDVVFQYSIESSQVAGRPSCLSWNSATSATSAASPTDIEELLPSSPEEAEVAVALQAPDVAASVSANDEGARLLQSVGIPARLLVGQEWASRRLLCLEHSQQDDGTRQDTRDSRQLHILTGTQDETAEPNASKDSLALSVSSLKEVQRHFVEGTQQDRHVVSLDFEDLTVVLRFGYPELLDVLLRALQPKVSLPSAGPALAG